MTRTSTLNLDSLPAVDDTAASGAIAISCLAVEVEGFVVMPHIKARKTPCEY
jgi:hypothetical protein